VPQTSSGPPAIRELTGPIRVLDGLGRAVMAAAAAGLAVWALLAGPASAVPVQVGDTPVAGIADWGDGAVTRVDPVGKIVATDVNYAGVSGGGGGAAARAGEQLHARDARKPRCLWRKRGCYPPANLWYRITVEFDGHSSCGCARGFAASRPASRAG
jgi:hypothetical protein